MVKKSGFEELCKSIDIIIKKRLEKIKFSYFLDGEIIAIQSDEYTVKIDGNNYTKIKARSSLTLAVGDLVQVCVKNGDFSRKFIDDKLLV